jgi:thymidine phosphorylase
MSASVDVRVLLLVGDQAEIVADHRDAGDPVRYPAAEIAEAVGLPVGDLPGRQLTATVGTDDTLSGWQLR